MKFKIDENLPIEAAEMLRQEGHDALTVFDQKMSGDADAQIASACQGDVIVTPLPQADGRIKNRPVIIFGSARGT